MSPLNLESRLPVACEAAKVWGLLIEPRTWKSWWPAVREARSKDFKPLREKSPFELTLQHGRLTSTMQAKVALCADGKSIGWDGKWLGVPLRHEWFLEPRPDGVRVVVRSRFTGWPVPLLKLFRLDRRWERTLVEQLRGLKRVAEQL
ncbi:MAG TPA: SRPBCC family protein [Thermoanaerobaculia bacterium]|nr:SRPBCC family protein [Thermoanaerobaculia bacterium]